jgi:hypothetical protein
LQCFEHCHSKKKTDQSISGTTICLSKWIAIGSKRRLPALHERLEFGGTVVLLKTIDTRSNTFAIGHCLVIERVCLQMSFNLIRRIVEYFPYLRFAIGCTFAAIAVNRNRVSVDIVINKNEINQKYQSKKKKKTQS